MDKSLYKLPKEPKYIDTLRILYRNTLSPKLALVMSTSPSSLPPSQGYTHLLTMVDRFTRWPAAIPLSSTETNDFARAFVPQWVARFGVPKEFTMDRRPNFTSHMWNSVCERIGINVNRTTAYHAQSNGLVERFHRRMKEYLKTNLDDPNWIDQSPWTMFGIRTTPKDDLKTSSVELVP